MHFLTVIWQLKTRYGKTMPFVLAVVAKSCNLRGDLPCWVFFYSSIFRSNTVILYNDCNGPNSCANVWSPRRMSFELSTSVLNKDLRRRYMLFLPTIPSKHSKVFTWQISQWSGYISRTKLWIFFNAGSNIALLGFYSLQKRDSPWRMRDFFHSYDLAHHEICIPKVSYPNFLRKLLP